MVELAATNPVMLPYSQWSCSVLLPFRYFGHIANSFGIAGHKNLVVHLVQGREDSSVSFIGHQLGCTVASAASFTYLEQK